MYGFDLTATSKEEQDKVTIDLLTSGGKYKERLAMLVVAELVVREQPEHLREFFMERQRHTLKIVRFTARPMVALARNSGPMQP
ncbi:TPA: DNA polymerase III subunit theta [Salmonella enterica]